MIKSLLKVGLLLVVGIVGYNYFFGTEAEKESSRVIIGKVRDLGKTVGTLLKNEKEKFDKGKYDDALEKIEGIYVDLKDRAKDNSELLDKIRDLEVKRDDLERRVDLTEKGAEDTAETNEIKKEMDDLVKRTEAVAKELE